METAPGTDTATALVLDADLLIVPAQVTQVATETAAVTDVDMGLTILAALDVAMKRCQNIGQVMALGMALGTAMNTAMDTAMTSDSVEGGSNMGELINSTDYGYGDCCAEEDEE